MKQAIEEYDKIDERKYNLGGTELYKPLLDLFSMKRGMMKR